MPICQPCSAPSFRLFPEPSDDFFPKYATDPALPPAKYCKLRGSQQMFNQRIAIRKCFFLFFWPLTGRCTRGTRIWRRLMVEVLEGCLYYNWLQNLKDTTIHYPSPISRPIPAQCHVAWLKLVDAGGQNPRMHMYNCYYGSCKWVFTSHCIYRFLFVYDIVKRYPSHMSECKCTHAA